MDPILSYMSECNVSFLFHKLASLNHSTSTQCSGHSVGAVNEKINKYEGLHDNSGRYLSDFQIILEEYGFRWNYLGKIQTKFLVIFVRNPNFFISSEKPADIHR